MKVETVCVIMPVMMIQRDVLTKLVPACLPCNSNADQTLNKVSQFASPDWALAPTIIG